MDQMHGDLRFLAEIPKCIDIRCRILGLDAPTKIEASVTSEALEELVKARRLKLQMQDALPDKPQDGEGD